MSSAAIALTVFVLVFGGGLAGLFLSHLLPKHHLSGDSKDAVKIALGVLATMIALVLGLLLNTARISFDARNNGLQQLAADIILLDRTMAGYGPETQEARDMLNRLVVASIQRNWPEGRFQPAGVRDTEMTMTWLLIQGKLAELSPRSGAQRWFQSRALTISADLAHTRWLLTEEQTERSIPMPLLVVLVSWLAILFGGLSLFAPRNTIVIVTTLTCALAFSAAISLILELDSPHWIQVSSAPLRNALYQLGH